MAQGNVFDDRTTALLLEMARLFVRNGRKLATPDRRRFEPASDGPIYVTNDSGETIPPYACMQVTGTEEIGPQNYLVVDKPADATGDAGTFIFNGPKEIIDDDEGVAQRGPIIRAFKDSGTVTAGEGWAPVSGQWYVEQTDSGAFIACGDDDVEDDVLKLDVSGGGGGGDKHYLFTLTATMASGSGACTIRSMADDTEVATSQTVVDTLGFFDGLASGQRGICIRQGGVYYAIGPYVTSVRWDDPDLEYSKDNATTWVNIDTAEECA